MKKLLVVILLVVGGLSPSVSVSAQAEELEELALDIEKLVQYKQILADLKKGYEILNGGYNTIRDISKGEFDLHKVFLDGLLAVSPQIKNYKRVADIIDYQLRIVNEYKTAFNQFKKGGWFTVDELGYMSRVYSNLVSLSLNNLEDLVTVLTAGKLRMSDDERMYAIDKVYADMREKLQFLRSFNNSTSVLSLQRAKEQQAIKTLQQSYDLK